MSLCRNSKLTMLLQDSLGGNAKALMIANLAPLPMHATETLSSLAFASKVRIAGNSGSCLWLTHICKGALPWSQLLPLEHALMDWES